jgi:hypothetical protein
MISAIISVVGMDKRAPPVELKQLNISFLYPNSILWFIRVMGVVRLTESLSLLPSH